MIQPSSASEQTQPGLPGVAYLTPWAGDSEQTNITLQPAHGGTIMAETNDETKLREELVANYQRVDALGLNEMSSGNLSVRCGEKMLWSQP